MVSTTVFSTSIPDASCEVDMGMLVDQDGFYKPLEVFSVFLWSEELPFFAGITMSYESTGTCGVGAIHSVWWYSVLVHCNCTSHWSACRRLSSNVCFANGGYNANGLSSCRCGGACQNGVLLWHLWETPVWQTTNTESTTKRSSQNKSRQQKESSPKNRPR